MPYRRCFRVGLWEFCVSMDGLLQHFIDIKLCASFEERIFNGTNQVDLCNLYHLYHRVCFGQGNRMFVYIDIDIDITRT